MSLRPLAVCTLAALACGAAPGRAPVDVGAHLLRAARPIPGRYVVVLDASAADVEVDARAADLGRRHRADVIQTWARAVRGFAARMTDADAAALAAEPGVAWVEEDGEVRLEATELGAPWGLDRVDQRSRPLDGAFHYGEDGAGVTAYVIDTGIRSTHRELSGRVDPGFTSVQDGRGTEDCHGHGTHVAGIVGGATYGVAKGARLVPVRVLDCAGSGSVSSTLSGIEWVTAHHVSPAVANLSLGTDPSPALDQAVQGSIASGVTYVVAAGNGAADACGQSPGRLPAALTVGATDALDAQASFSNYGACVDLLAPGVGITSAWATADDALQVLSGTSMAAPHVSGAAALYLSGAPSATPADVASALVAASTGGAVTGAGAGTPDRLLYCGPQPVAVSTAVADACGRAAELLPDPSFEDGGAPWTATPGVLDASGWPAARSGRWKLWLAGYGSGHADAASVTLALPADACGVRLDLWLRVMTDERGPGARDQLAVNVRDPSGAVLATLAGYSNLDASDDYVERSLDLTPFRGRMVQLWLEATEDAALQTSFLVDDVTVTATSP